MSDQGRGGHGILAYGNPDTAQNVSAYVPGLGSTLDDVATGEGDHALNVWNATQTLHQGSSVASIAWLGYDAPVDPGQVFNLDPRPLQALSEDDAAKGAVSFDEFISGLRATHEGVQPHITAIGHSYGTTVVGLASARPGGIGADDVILIGSPGAGVQKASQMNVAPRHVWVGAAKTDPVAEIPSPGLAHDAAISLATLPMTFGLPLLASPDRHQLYFGTDPASGEFGANRFSVADGQPGDAHFHYMQPLRQGHSAPTDTSITNIANIVVGQYGQVTREAPR